MDRVQLEDVSKRYLLGERGNLRETLSGLALQRHRRTRDELWSLRDINLAVQDGEALGVVGRNGAGKSTLLKVLTGITAPTTGVCRTRGRVAALLEVGTGFHPELTGRENIALNAAVLGLSRRELRERLDAIIDFAGVEAFLDTPVKRYSSGMYLRLAFSVAAHLEPDVLIVDEILAVGDVEFQRKCLQRVSQAGSEGRTVIVVSHDLDLVVRVCSRTVWLEEGRVREDGPTAGVLPSYLRGYEAAGGATRAASRDGLLVVQSVVALDGAGLERNVLLRDEPVVVRIDFELAAPVRGLDVALYLTSARGVRVIDEALSDRGTVDLPAGRHRLEMTVPPLLNTGEYAVGAWFGDHARELLDEPGLRTLVLEGPTDRPQRAVVLGLPFRLSSLDAPSVPTGA